MDESLQTKRLLIRRFTADDWRDLHEYLSDPRVVRYEPYPPFSQQQCREAARQRAASKDFWAVCLPDTGKLIGNIYLAQKEQASWEIGYVFGHAYQGKGYATEAVVRMVDLLFARYSGHRVYAACNPENMPSWKLLERVGFRREGHLKKNVYFNCDDDGAPLWQDTFLYALLKEDWPRHRPKRANGEPAEKHD